MTQPQQQQYMPPRPYSPPQSATSPTQQPFALPPNKRQRVSPNPPSQPGSPYVASPYAMSPNASTPASAGASPLFPNVQLPAYSTPYSNGHTTPTSSIPLPQPSHQPPQHQPLQHQPPQQYQSPLGFPNHHPVNQHPQFNMPPGLGQAAGTMGPPSKPVEKAREEADVMDVLGGTGIDLREEEQYTFQMYNTSFNSQISGSQSGTISSGHSFTQFPPGSAESLYGSGPANAPGESANSISQDEYHKKAADKAWHDAAHNLATSRQLELNNPFLSVGLLQSKMRKIAGDNGLGLNIDSKGTMGTMKLPEHFENSTVTVKTAIGSDAAMTATKGNFLSLETQLVDQLALLSIASKHRLRGLIEEAAKLAKARRTGSHGIIPEDWAAVAADGNAAASSAVAEGGLRDGWESAVSPRSNPLKRSISAANGILPPILDNNKKPTGTLQATNEVATALRRSAIKERDLEEERLKKRQARESGVSRQGSIIPTTPGSVAPDPFEKAPTKKEQKKKLESKATEAATHIAANSTSSQFLGGGGSSLFGKKKKGGYSWLTGGGGPGSGASTPSLKGPSTPGGPVQPPAPVKLTAEPARRIGTWREDKEKGVGIQIRDWIAVLEQDGHDKKSLQKAYLIADN